MYTIGPYAIMTLIGLHCAPLKIVPDLFCHFKSYQCKKLPEYQLTVLNMIQYDDMCTVSPPQLKENVLLCAYVLVRCK